MSAWEADALPLGDTRVGTSIAHTRETATLSFRCPARQRARPDGAQDDVRAEVFALFVVTPPRCRRAAHWPSPQAKRSAASDQPLFDAGEALRQCIASARSTRQHHCNNTRRTLATPSHSKEVAMMHRARQLVRNVLGRLPAPRRARWTNALISTIACAVALGTAPLAAVGAEGRLTVSELVVLSLIHI